MLCRLQLEQSLGGVLPGWRQPEEQMAFNPFVAMNAPLQQWGFSGIRLVGLTLLMPIINKIFWREFPLYLKIGYADFYFSPHVTKENKACQSTN